MDRQYVHFEDNRDGTITTTVKMDGGEEMTFVLAIAFDSIGSLVSPEAKAQTHAAVADRMIRVPGSPEDL